MDSSGLYDRDSFVEAMEERILDPLHRGQPGALLLLDIDSFHIVNDSLGHEAGDRLLETVAATLRAESRVEDLPARICADEFGLLLPRATPAQAMATAERLIALVRERGKPAVGASVGIATFGGTGEEVTAEGLMITADIALCEAKEDGRRPGGRRGQRPEPETDLGRPDPRGDRPASGSSSTRSRSSTCGASASRARSCWCGCSTTTTT